MKTVQTWFLKCFSCLCECAQIPCTLSTNHTLTRSSLGPARETADPRPCLSGMTPTMMARGRQTVAVVVVQEVRTGTNSRFLMATTYPYQMVLAPTGITFTIWYVVHHVGMHARSFYYIFMDFCLGHDQYCLVKINAQKSLENGSPSFARTCCGMSIVWKSS